jgi:hypothetical protein
MGWLATGAGAGCVAGGAAACCALKATAAKAAASKKAEILLFIAFSSYQSRPVCASNQQISEKRE